MFETSFLAKHGTSQQTLLSTGCILDPSGTSTSNTEELSTQYSTSTTELANAAHPIHSNPATDSSSYTVKGTQLMNDNALQFEPEMNSLYDRLALTVNVPYIFDHPHPSPGHAMPMPEHPWKNTHTVYGRMSSVDLWRGYLIVFIDQSRASSRSYVEAETGGRNIEPSIHRRRGYEKKSRDKLNRSFAKVLAVLKENGVSIQQGRAEMLDAMVDLCRNKNIKVGD